MLRDVLKSFLDGLGERDFDDPLLAMLHAQGFFEIHLIHGSYEFGKDVIAQKRDPATGETRQYAIQSKAGDIKQGEWRAVRPQLEEAVYNTRAHPGFDAALHRVAVLATTGSMKGAAAVDAQEFREAIRRREPTADVIIWDQEHFLGWLTAAPAVASSGDGELEAAVRSIRRHELSEPELERFTRRWCDQAGSRDGPTQAAAAIEAAVLAHEFRSAARLDMSALTGLHLLRSAVVAELSPAHAKASETLNRQAALRLFSLCVTDLLAEVELVLDDPKRLAWSTADAAAIITNPAVVCRLIELFALLELHASNARNEEAVTDAHARTTDADEGADIDARTDGDAVLGTNRAELATRARRAVMTLASTHPGSRRPISDRDAVSVIAPAIVLTQTDRTAGRDYLRAVAQWLLSRHAESEGGLGLASIEEGEDVAAERLFGGALEATTLAPRKSSYLTTVLLDLLAILGEDELFQAVRRNVEASRIIACATSADESTARWRRGGGTVWPEVRIEYTPEAAPTTLVRPNVDAIDAVMLASVCRSRHDTRAIIDLTAGR